MRAAADLVVRSFPFFLRFVTTKDEAESDPKKRIKLLPVDDKPYILHCAEVMQRELVLWQPKSRRMILTWLNSAELVWQSLVPHSHLFVQQTKEDDSDWLVRERCKFIWDHLPEWLRFYAMNGKGTEAEYKYCKMTLPNRSQIWGVAQGPEQFRKFTPSGIFSDEVAVQDSFRDAQTAIMPLAEKGCRVRFVSSARGGTQFAHMVNSPKVEGTMQTPMRGIREWRLQSGGYVLRIHYSADPDKDPERNGRAWMDRIAATFDGGAGGSDWKQEMEIDFMAKSGTLIYENFDPAKHVAPPFSDEFLANHPGPYWRALDYGRHNPTACLWFTLWDDVYYCFREFYKPGLTPKAIKQGVHALSIEPRYEFTVIDPRSDRSDIEGNSITPFYLLNSGEHKLGAIKANSSGMGIDLTRQWLFEGRFKVTSNCVQFIDEIEGYVLEEWGNAADKHNAKETPKKKNDHCMNAWKYFANGVAHMENRIVIPIQPRINNEYAQRRERLMHPQRGKWAGQSTVMRGYYG